MTISLSRRQVLDTVAKLQESEATLAVRAEELDMVMSHLDDGVAIIEEGGRVLHANQALLTAFGTREPEPLDRVADPARAAVAMPATPTGGRSSDAENPLVPGDGRRDRRRRGDPPHRRVRRLPGARVLGLPGPARRREHPSA